MSAQVKVGLLFPSDPTSIKNRLDKTAINTEGLWGLVPVQSARPLCRAATTEYPSRNKTLCPRGESGAGTSDPY